MSPEREPLWKEEVSFRTADEAYVNRRQFMKFTLLTSLAMFCGSVWIVVRSWLRRAHVLPEMRVADVGELAVGEVKVFGYPEPQDPCLLIRLDRDSFVAYSQKCTHLSCAVVYDRKADQIECPCHHGFFSARTGEVLQGPPPRPLVRIRLERRDDQLVAVGLEPGGDRS
jgi:Rieske Fe-S protein